MTRPSADIGLETRLAVNPDLVLRVEDDDYALLFDPDSGSVQILNASAVEIWKRLDGRKSLAEILAELQQVFDGMGNEAGRQVVALANALAEMGAVHDAEST